jgi:outer membrane autotransporter protein
VKRLFRLSKMQRLFCSPHADSFDLQACLGRLLLILIFLVTQRALSQSFVVTIEPPGAQFQQSPLEVNGQLYGAEGVSVETFNNLSTGFHSAPFQFATGEGTYDHGQIQKADVYGGVDGNTNYLTVNSSIQRASQPTVLMLNKPARYFGMWWSAGDPQNVLQFYSNGKLIQTLTTSDVTNFINALQNGGGYRGNPNAPFKGQNSGENYAFLNFFADPNNPNVTFNEVVFTNEGTTGFESDNHTIAVSYDSITGTEVGPPEPLDPGPGDTDETGPGGNTDTPEVEVPPGGSVKVDPGGDIIDTGPATIEPGGSITIDDGGMVMVDGPTKIDPGGSLNITVGGPLCQDAGKLLVIGHTTINGILTLSSPNGFHVSPGDHYTLLVAAGGLSGTFSQIRDTLNTSGLTRADIYAPNGFVVAYLPAGYGALDLQAAVPIPLNAICDVNTVLVSALTPNADQLSAPYDTWFSLANTQRFNLEARLDELMAGSTGFVSNMTYPAPQPPGKEVLEGKETKETVSSPLQPAPENRWGVWVTGYGDWTNIDNEGLARGYNYTTGGMTVGVDYRVLDHFVIGLMGGYAHTWTDLKPGSVDLDTGWGGIYTGYFNRGLYALAAAFGGGNAVDTSRATVVGGRASGSTDSQDFSTFGSAGYDFRFGQLTIGPTVALQYSYMNLDGYTEHSSFAPLRVSEESNESLRSDLGFRAWYIFQAGRIPVRPFVRAAWEHEYKESALPVSAELVGFPGTVTVYSPYLGHDSAVVNAGVAVQWTPTISTYVSYDGELGRDRYDSNGVSGGVQINF